MYVIDELVEHLRLAHSADLALGLEDGVPAENWHVWNTYHRHLHKREGTSPDMDHERQIWVLSNEAGPAMAFSVPEDAEAVQERLSEAGPCAVKEITLQPNSIPPIYGGPTLLDWLWEEMDSIMDRLMTGQAADDGRDPGRAEMLGYVLATVTNAYAPNMPAIREEAKRRWSARAAA